MHGVVETLRHFPVDGVDAGRGNGGRGNGGRRDDDRAEREGGETLEHTGRHDWRVGKMVWTDHKGMHIENGAVPSTLNHPTAPAG